MLRSRRRALVAVLAAAPLLLTGCAVFSPSTTAHETQVADGVDAQLGDVAARNLLVVGDKGTTGVVSGALVNNGTQPVVVTVTPQGGAAPVQVQVAGGSLVDLGTATGQTAVTTGSLSQPAGTLVPLQISSPAGGSVQISVPLLPPSGLYATVTPTAE